MRCECFGGHTYGKPCPHDCHPYGVGWKPETNATTTVVAPTTNATEPDVWSALRGEA